MGSLTMQAILNILRPTPLLILLLLIAILLQGAFFGSTTMTFSMVADTPEETRSMYGIGAPITVKTVHGSTTYDTKWAALAMNLGVCYLLAALLSASFVQAARSRRPAFVYGVLFLRVAGFLSSAVGAFFIFGSVRTAQFGPSLKLYSPGLLILLPFLCVAVVSLIGLGWRRLLFGAAVWAAATLMAVEGFAQTQEAVFRGRYGGLPPSADAVFEPRWWPFRGNVLIYLPERAEWLGDC